MDKQVVCLTSEAGNYIPTMYSVIAATVGGTKDTSFLWLECIAYGIPTENDLNTLKLSKKNGTKPDFSSLTGVKGEYDVKKLSEVQEYPSGDYLIYGEKNIGRLNL